MGREVQPPQLQPSQQQEVSYTVEQLVAFNPYDPDTLPDLEKYVNEQVSSQTCSLDANLCLLRHYQFEPERMSTQIVSCILIKALMAMPAPDFSLCLFLIPERVQMQEPFKTLIFLSHFLEEDSINSGMRLLGAGTCLRPFQAINVEGPSLDKFIERQVTKYGWAIDKGQLIIISQNEFNHPELKKSDAETIPLEHITRIFPILG